MWNSSTFNSDWSRTTATSKMKIFVTINNDIKPLAIAMVLDQQVKSLKKPVENSTLCKVAGLKPKTQLCVV